jgi:mannosyl-oligosaccharide alpha-1,2-mannosidase
MVLLSRLRRHRLPIFITIVFVVLIYHFTSLRDSAGARHAVDRLKEHNLPHIHQTEPAAGAPPLIDGKKANQLPLPVVKPEQKPESKPPSRIEPPKKPDAPTSDNAAADNTSLKKQEGSDSSKQQAETSSTKDSENVAQIDDDPHWSRTPEHYPIPTRSIISLPTNSPVDVPYIQAVFPAESESEKNARMSRLNSIKDTFIASWNAYKKHAWGHDELMPVSGDYIDTFGGWGASLVDALDTLWIMNLKDEFEEAVEAVGKINFHSSKLMRIPLFETTIRHLGGLIAAYDISEGKYNVLLEKAIELADLLLVTQSNTKHSQVGIDIE